MGPFNRDKSPLTRPKPHLATSDKNESLLLCRQTLRITGQNGSDLDAWPAASVPIPAAQAAAFGVSWGSAFDPKRKFKFLLVNVRFCSDEAQSQLPNWSRQVGDVYSRLISVVL